MKELKPTKGRAEIGDENNQGCEVSLTASKKDLTISLDRQCRFSGNFIISRNEMLSNAHVIMEAFNVFNETGMSPRYMLETWSICESLNDTLQSELTEIKQQNADLLEALNKITNLSEDKGREGCTYSDTDYDSMSTVYGYNLALAYSKEIAEKAINGQESRNKELEEEEG